MKTRDRWSLLIVVAFCVIAFGISYRSVQGQKRSSERVAWEYTTLLIPYADSDKIAPLLNTQGALGWEVVDIRYPDDKDRNSSHLFVLFKRPK